MPRGVGVRVPSSAQYAKIAQLVEHNLAKVGVAGSNPVFRSTPALVVELVDTQDLKSCASFGVRVQVPPGVHRKPDNHLIVRFFCFYQAQHGHNTLKINEKCDQSQKLGTMQKV